MDVLHVPELLVVLHHCLLCARWLHHLAFFFHLLLLVLGLFLRAYRRRRRLSLVIGEGLLELLNLLLECLLVRINRVVVERRLLEKVLEATHVVPHLSF